MARIIDIEFAEDKATNKQLGFIEELLYQKRLYLKDITDSGWDQITRQEASELIEDLIQYSDINF